MDLPLLEFEKKGKKLHPQTQQNGDNCTYRFLTDDKSLNITFKIL